MFILLKQNQTNLFIKSKISDTREYCIVVKEITWDTNAMRKHMHAMVILLNFTGYHCIDG